MEIDEAGEGFIGVRMGTGMEASAGPFQPIQYIGMEQAQDQHQRIMCCMCAVVIPANPTGKCVNCLKTQVDATSEIERNLVLPYCKHCNRYQRPPWLACEWESPELLALCLKRIRGLQGTKRDGARLVDAGFLYTEPHSRRIKVKLTLQKEVVASTVVEQDCVVEFVIQPTQCDDCKRAFTPHTWTAVVQVRQRAQHKRSLMYLEQAILKQNAHEKVLKAIEAPDVLTRRHLTEFVILDIEPVDMRTVSVAAHAHRFVNPTAKKSKDTRRRASSDAMVDVPSSHTTSSAVVFSDPRCDPLAGRLVDVEIARAADFGVNDSRTTVRSHLGKVLRVGDWCLGYDLSTLNLGGIDEDTGIESKIPYEVILVRKTRQLGAETRKRNWVLQRLPIEKASAGPAKMHQDERRDLEEFKRDLEEDSVMRQGVNLWKDTTNHGDSTNVDAEDVQLCELLDRMTLNDADGVYE
ncbi:60S ribosomal export protein NMD3-like [Condylostylus longicornis]|uniref:60S ribosomal export protein NMD3-like n=1 Tax=Condylostylus longicornis TaxID=2530218 RepID=UPI00244DD8F9|nr:60S ribosomal export protein NMD3-like [Condylostylus longicornis]